MSLNDVLRIPSDAAKLADAHTALEAVNEDLWRVLNQLDSGYYGAAELTVESVRRNIRKELDHIYGEAS